MEESDYDEQEIIVYLDFESYVSPEELDNENLDFKIIGVDATNPIVQVNGKLFKGSYDYCTGTNVFFEDDTNPPIVDPLFDANPRQFYKVYTKTQKVLKMERIYVEKVIPSGENKGCEIINDLQIRKAPNMSYGDALNMLLPTGTDPPRPIHEEEILSLVSDEQPIDSNDDSAMVQIKKEKTNVKKEES